MKQMYLWIFTGLVVTALLNACSSIATDNEIDEIVKPEQALFEASPYPSASATLAFVDATPTATRFLILPTNTRVSPSVTSTSIPPTDTPTPAPIVIVSVVPTFLPATSEWLPVVTDAIRFEVPVGWEYYHREDDVVSSHMFFSERPDSSEELELLDHGIARIEYGAELAYPTPPPPPTITPFVRIGEGYPAPLPTSVPYITYTTKTVVVDGYATDYRTFIDDPVFESATAPHWIGVIVIYTPSYIHAFSMHCWAHRNLGTEKMIEHYHYCESLLQHLIDTTQIGDPFQP